MKDDILGELGTIYARLCPTCKVLKLFASFCVRERYQLPGANWSSEKVTIHDDCNECRAKGKP